MTARNGGLRATRLPTGYAFYHHPRISMATLLARVVTGEEGWHGLLTRLRSAWIEDIPSLFSILLANSEMMS